MRINFLLQAPSYWFSAKWEASMVLYLATVCRQNWPAKQVPFLFASTTAEGALLGKLFSFNQFSVR